MHYNTSIPSCPNSAPISHYTNTQARYKLFVYIYSYTFSSIGDEEKCPPVPSVVYSAASARGASADFSVFILKMARVPSSMIAVMPASASHAWN